MALIDNLLNNLKVIHKVKNVPTSNSKIGIHFVEGGGVYIVTKDPIILSNKIVKKIYERSDHYLKEETDNLLQAQKDVIDNGYTTSDSLLQAQINNLQPLNIKKAYLTKASADSDINPIGDDGDPIGLGQLIVVTSDTTNNGIYRLKNLISGEPTWELVGTLGDLSTYTLNGGSNKTLKQVEDEIVQLSGEMVKDMLLSESFMPQSATYTDGLINSPFNVIWADGATGSITVTRNSDNLATKVVAIHIIGGVTKTITCDITRDSEGNTTNSTITIA